MHGKTISQEVIAIRAKTPLVNIVKDYVKEMRALWPDWPSNAKSFRYGDKQWLAINTKFIKSVRAATGIKIAIDIADSKRDYNAGVYTLTLDGHTGTRWTANGAKYSVNDGVDISDVITIDLENVRVSGKMADGIVYKMFFTEALMFNSKLLTDDEVIATILHEFGHVLNNFITLGDYVWLNYYLTDGIEILMGTKKNKYKLEIFSDTAIKRLVPEEDREKFINDRNENNAKRVILSLAKNAQRHHLTNNSILANRREEQMADLFTSRLGYGRALVTMQYKLDKYFGDFDKANWLAETIKVAFFITTLPIAILLALTEPEVATGIAGRYDNPQDRILRVRRDLVAQLKNSPTEVEGSLLQDIEVIDKILKDYSSQRTLYDGLVTFFRPSIRKMEQNTQVENDLESLFNNDLFIQAAKLRKS